MLVPCGVVSLLEVKEAGKLLFKQENI